VWIILAGSAIGLSAGTQGRLLGSAFYALGDPRPPLRAALVRVAITAVLGWAFALPLRDLFGYSVTWGAFGLTASAGFAAWIEFSLLRIWLARRIGPLPIPVRLGLGALGAAAVAGGLGYLTEGLVSSAGARDELAALAAIAVFGGTYLAIMAIAGVPETAALTRRLRLRR
jgi:putative peptidoglycan lipid II flippase